MMKTAAILLVLVVAFVISEEAQLSAPHREERHAIEGSAGYDELTARLQAEFDASQAPRPTPAPEPETVIAELTASNERLAAQVEELQKLEEENEKLESLLEWSRENTSYARSVLNETQVYYSRMGFQRTVREQQAKIEALESEIAHLKKQRTEQAEAHEEALKAKDKRLEYKINHLEIVADKLRDRAKGCYKMYHEVTDFIYESDQELKFEIEKSNRIKLELVTVKMQVETLQTQINKLTAQNGQLEEDLEEARRGITNFWPLNEEFAGQNLAASDAELVLENVTYDSASGGFGQSVPAHFSPDSLASVTNSSGVTLDSRGFSFMAAVRGRVKDFFRWTNAEGKDSYIKLTGHGKLYMFLQFEGCGDLATFNATDVSEDEWHIVGVSYDAATRTIAMFLDGEVDEKVLYLCNRHKDIVQIKGGVINKQDEDYRYPSDGYVTCISTYNKPMTYYEMYQATIPFCKGESLLA